MGSISNAIAICEISHNADVSANLKLLNALFDVRVTLAYLRSLKQLIDAKVLDAAISDTVCEPLPPEHTPPPLFSKRLTIRELEATCTEIEASFASLLNSFPGDALPKSVTPHVRTFAFSYLAQLLTKNQSWPIPVLLLDDLQDLYPEQREHLRGELIRRSNLPRWVAVRKHVYGLEELLSLEGTTDEREVREIDLDAVPLRDFRRFLENVTLRRLRSTDSFAAVRYPRIFASSLKGVPESVPTSRVLEPLS